MSLLCLVEFVSVEIKKAKFQQSISIGWPDVDCFFVGLMKEQLQVSYTAEAIQNKVEGKIVLQLVVCSNGRVSEIGVDEALPFGLTERAVEAIRKVRFQPALLGTQPVSVMTKQTFARAQQVCTALSP
jgi:TonB family protein